MAQRLSELWVPRAVKGLNGDVVSHFTVIDQQPRVSMQNLMLYLCSIVKALVKSIYFAKKGIPDITVPLYNLTICYRSGFQTVRGYKRLGFVTLKFGGFTCNYGRRYSVPCKLCSNL